MNLQLSIVIVTVVISLWISIVLHFRKFCIHISRNSVYCTLIVADVCDDGKVSCALLLDDDIELIDGSEVVTSDMNIGDCFEAWVYKSSKLQEWQALNDSPRTYVKTANAATSVILVTTVLGLILMTSLL